MTVAMVAEFPWGRLRRILESLPGAVLDSSAILAADTRWTYEGLPPEDFGQKLWPITAWMGAVLAGDVRAGEEGLECLGNAIQKREFERVEEITKLASDSFRKTYSAHRTKRRIVHPVYYLLAMRNNRGHVVTAYLSSEANFEAIFLRGPHVIGWPESCRLFTAKLDAFVNHKMEDGQFDLDALPWAMLIAGALDEVIEEGCDKVGGGVQMAILDAHGWQEHGISVLPEGADIEAPENWKTVTRPLDDLKRYHDRWRVPRLAFGAPDLRLLASTN